MYVPAGTPVIVLLAPLSEVFTVPGVLVTVHVPVEGNPLNSTLPVETGQVGCVIAPTIGADGVVG